VFDPGAALLVAFTEFLYLRALKVLGRRGVEVPRGQIVLWHAGILMWAIGFFSPIHAWGDDLLSAHMAEHLLIADLAAPLLLAGARNPVLMFLLPKPALATLARSGWPRRAFRRIRQPLVAIPIYAVGLYGWHFSLFFDAAVRHPLVHALQHLTFVAIGILVWWSALEPKRRRLRGELWKIPYLLGARMVGMMLGMSYVIIRVPVYTAVYGSGERRFGLSALADQQIAGALMVSLDLMIMVFALCFFFYKASQEADRDEQREREALLTSP
jgi:putative membrane protein